MKNLFISGDIGVGKSHLLRNVLEELNVSLGGFVTGKDYDYKGHTVYIKSLNDFVSFKNVAYVVGGTDIYSAQVYSENFDSFGARTIEFSIANRDVTVMDEIGVMERDSPIFLQSIINALDSDKPVVGVIKNRKDDYLESIKSRHDTKVLFLTGSNGVETYEEIMDWMIRNNIGIKEKKSHQWQQKRIDMYERALSYEHTGYPDVLLNELINRTDNLGAKTWLDLGAGTGAFSIPLAKKSKSVFCIDSSFNMLLNLSEKLHIQKLSNIEASLVPFSSLQNKTFDYVLSSFSGNALRDRHSLAKFIEMAVEKAFIICPPEKGRHNFNGEILEERIGRKIKSFSGGPTEILDFLETNKISYHYEEIDFNFPQVFNTREECFYFFRDFYQIKRGEEAILEAFIGEYLRSDRRYYVFDNYRRAGFFIIEK
ncbi:MAG: nucleoside-triphosphatase [Eubacteriales bacterium]|nr:nucleoside-triphosphatase [Eubacteriales bacterium]